MTVWHHSRRGCIQGDRVGGDETWLHIRLAVDCPRASMVARGFGPVDEAGTIITVRRSLVREVF